MTPVSRIMNFSPLYYPKSAQFQCGYPTMFSLLGWHHQISMRSSCLTKKFWVIMAIFVCCGLVLTVQINFGKCHIKKFQISRNLKWIAEEKNSVDHFILKSVIKMSQPIIKNWVHVFCVHKSMSESTLCMHLQKPCTSSYT